VEQIILTTPFLLMTRQLLHLGLTDALTFMVITPEYPWYEERLYLNYLNRYVMRPRVRS